MENEETYTIIDKKGDEILSDMNALFVDFIQECDHMIALYKHQRYTQAEQLKTKLSDQLDDVMRIGEKR